MNNAIWLALGLGFLGSLHCVGMCGPLVMALPQPNGEYRRWAKLVGGRLLYNFGRIGMYAFLGAGVGLLGSAARFSGLQQIVSIATGSLILLWLVIPKKFYSQGLSAQYAAKLIAHLRVWFAPILGLNFFTAQFGLGLLNGLLPCGLVYVAIAGAILQPTVLTSALFMALFGLGTFPALIFFGLLTGKIKNHFRFSIQRLLPAGLAVVAILLILRGLALDLPFVSPKISGAPFDQSAPDHACH